MVALVEVAAGIVRRTADVGLAQEALRLLLAMPTADFHGLDISAAMQAAGVATVLRVQAGDAAYAAVAHESGSTLVTLDQELLEWAAPLVDACTAPVWLARA
jgi:predicted nucleic acid-binding protein